MTTSALICVGGGRGERFGGDKLAEPLRGRSVFATSLLALRRALPDAPLVAVVPGGRKQWWASHLSQVIESLVVVEGGARRQDSVRRGVLAAVEIFAGDGLELELAVIHDAARPLVDPDDVLGVVEGLGDASAAILCSRVADTVKRVETRTAGRGMRAEVVVATLGRDVLRLAQTPQVVRWAALRRAWEEVPDDLYTDEASLLETAGLEVRAVEARRPNPKVTTKMDLELVRALALDLPRGP